METSINKAISKQFTLASKKFGERLFYKKKDNLHFFSNGQWLLSTKVIPDSLCLILDGKETFGINGGMVQECPDLDAVIDHSRGYGVDFSLFLAESDKHKNGIRLASCNGKLSGLNEDYFRLGVELNYAKVTQSEPTRPIQYYDSEGVLIGIIMPIRIDGIESKLLSFVAYLQDVELKAAS